MNDRPAPLVLALLAAMPLLGFGPLLAAQETAELPYRVFYRQLQLVQDLERFDKLVHDMGIESTAGVAPTEIRLTIEDGTKTYEFRPDAQGRVELPLRPDWSEADLVVHTNQPKGTLGLRFGFGARPLAATRMRYRDLMDIRRQFQQALAGAAGTTGETLPNLTRLQLQFEPSPHAGVTILAAEGRQVYPADAEGAVELAEDAALWEENPEIVLDSLPKAVVPKMN
jgi:hypothetical protein